MSRPDDGRALPWTFLKRQVRPYALAVSFATAVVFVSMLTESWRVGAVVAAGTVHNTLAYRYYPLLLPGGVMPT